MFSLKALTAGFVAVAAFTSVAGAQEITLRLHQMLPPQATIPAEALKPWGAKVMEESGGRLKIEQYDAMALGGTPPQLVDQVADGVVDMIWTVIGYTPGRYPTTEAFELPFMVTTGEATSKAFHEYCEKYCMEEFAGMKVIAFHTHGPGLIHSKNPIEKLEDMQGVKIRGGSRTINQMLEALGSTPVGMPVPAVSEALSKGVIGATTIPWEVTPSLRVSELVKNHTGFTGDEGLYTQTFVFAMNQASYDALPDDMKAVIDANSGIEAAAMFGRVMDSGDARGLKIAQDLGNNIITLDEAETQRWKDTAAPLIDAWIEEMNGKGMDANAMVEDARAMIAKHLGS
ncbi:TRAP transporter substrate-binding protein [Aliihoeflea sp. 40Bstr573]|uniref:TRAP transporter substrate-binding protein n=1 Tax=Aliihoeflea sp. 40Bstr573 TaxID=2696467 RepID=UPI002095F474|nr:TRAP transporter substrate-binding protein [Aliihoeflea sp. 40Bstr573]MCO6388818.1 C4-dicarboxylate ABC transporter [Aliihoeflea sp. 40Bstr573]